MLILSIVFSILIYVTIQTNGVSPKSEVRYFPDGFVFGASTASYQIEGGAFDDGNTIHTHFTNIIPKAKEFVWVN